MSALAENPVSPSEGPSSAVEITRGDSGISATPYKFHYSFQLTLRGVYDDNIFITHTDRVGDYYFAIEPGLTIGYGDMIGREGNYLRLDYVPSLFVYVDHGENNTLQHLVHLEGFHRFSRLALTLGQDVAILDGTDINQLTGGTTTGQVANIDVGRRTRLNTFTTRLGWTYDLTGKTFLSGGFDNFLYDYESSLTSSDSLSGALYINYNYSPKLVVGVGGTGGYNWVDPPTPDQTFEQANVRAIYQVSGKVSLNISGGIEVRQFGGGGDHVSPVYELAVTYQPFDGSAISLTGSSRTFNSASSAGQDFSATNLILGLRQRFLRRIYLGLSAGYEHSEYFSALADVSATRNDNYYFVQPGIDVTITRWWTAGVYYLHRENDSSFNDLGFRDNQLGFRAALVF